jgi:hypothetical protein
LLQKIASAFSSAPQKRQNISLSPFEPNVVTA